MQALRMQHQEFLAHAQMVLRLPKGRFVGTSDGKEVGMKKTLTAILGLALLGCENKEEERRQQYQRKEQTRSVCESYQREIEAAYGSRFSKVAIQELRSENIPAAFAKEYAERFDSWDIRELYNNRTRNAAEGVPCVVPVVANKFHPQLHARWITMLYNNNVSSEQVNPIADICLGTEGMNASPDELVAICKANITSEEIMPFIALNKRYHSHLNLGDVLFYHNEHVSLEEVEKVVRQKAIEAHASHQ